MRKAISTLLVSLALAGAAGAGGPVVVVEEHDVVVEERPPSSNRVLPFLLIPLAVCIVFCGDEGG